jgi:hypothetical protein
MHSVNDSAIESGFAAVVFEPSGQLAHCHSPLIVENRLADSFRLSIIIFAPSAVSTL